MTPRPDGRGCPAGEALTAFAHGELSDATRARVSAHVLTCDRCRASLDATRHLLRRLRGLDVGAEIARRPAARRVRGIAAAAGVLVALSAWALAPSRGPSPGPAAVAATAPLRRAPDLAPLLSAQRTDGRWTTGEGVAARDEAATGLALLVLAPRAQGPVSQGPVARALAAGTRWLLGRQRADGRFGSVGPEAEDHAIATAALLALDAASGDPRVHAAADRAVRHLARSLRDEPASPRRLRWSAHALARARALGWTRVADALGGVESRLAAMGEPAGDALPVEGTSAWTQGRRDGASVALRLLREETAG